MATEKIDLTAPVEPVGNVAEDTQTNAAVAAAEVETTESLACDEQPVAPSHNADFADEEAALAADEAGLEIGEETAEERAAEMESADAAAGDELIGKSKSELVELFSSKIENEPVQTLRRTVEAIKIAFYKRHRSEVEAARREFIEAGGKEEEFAPAPDRAEARFKELFAIYREHRDKYMA
ncbi:MAG: DUF349 domain-containing protein, partial [Alistipes sp.]|nr:DUF349 domain-containing protein [Alistipes sp.]